MLDANIRVGAVAAAGMSRNRRSPPPSGAAGPGPASSERKRDVAASRVHHADQPASTVTVTPCTKSEFLAGEVDSRSRQLRRFQEVAARRSQCAHLRNIRAHVRAAQMGVERRSDIARRERVDVDVVLPDFDCERAGEVFEVRPSRRNRPGNLDPRRCPRSTSR